MVGVAAADDETVAAPTAEINQMLFLGAATGVEHRFGDSLILGVLGELTYAGSNYSALGCGLEASWLIY